MSGIIAVAHWLGERAASVVAPMIDALGHRAHDGADWWVSPDGSMALAHLHFWTTPEELGERQPLVEDGLALAFDGRLDNRAEVARALGMSGAEAGGLSDAALVLRAYQAWGEAMAARLAGPYALVVLDHGARQVLWARDAVGCRTLCWYRDDRQLLLASEPVALLAHPMVPDDPDEVWLAHMLAVRTPPAGTTPFAAIRETLAAEQVVATPAGARSARYWRLEFDTYWSRAPEGEVMEGFRQFLGQAVQRRMRSPRPVGVFLSGGLDSPPVAALAARSLDRGRLKTFSWYFDQLAECDERSFIQPVVDQYNLDPTWVPADDAWALRDYRHWPHNPNEPDYNCYRFLQDRIAAAVVQTGTRSVLDGHGGDDLYFGCEFWLADLLAHGRWREAWKEVHRHARRVGWPVVLRSRSIRRVLSGPARRWGLRRGYRPGPAPGWLTGRALEMLAADDGQLRAADGRLLRPFDHGVAAEALPATFHGHRQGLERRQPYRDRDLLVFALSLPSYYYFHHGVLKRIVRDAMVGILPEVVRTRKRRSDLSPLFHLGVRDREANLVLQLMDEAMAVDWRGLVQPEILADTRLGQMGDDSLEMAVWYCLTYATWQERGPGVCATECGPSSHLALPS